MKEKIVLSFLLSLVLCSNIVPVSAASQEIANVNGTSTTATVDYSFSVLPSDERDITIKISTTDVKMRVSYVKVNGEMMFSL